MKSVPLWKLFAALGTVALVQLMILVCAREKHIASVDLATTSDGKIQLYSVDDVLYVHDSKSPDRAIAEGQAGCFLDSGRRAVFADRKGNLSTIDITSGTSQILSHPGPSEKDTDVAFDPVSRTIVFVRLLNNGNIWEPRNCDLFASNLDRFQPVRITNGCFHSIRLAPDAIGGGRVYAMFFEPHLDASKFGPGEYVASVTLDGRHEFRNLGSPAQLPGSVSLSPQSNQIALSAGNPGEYRLFNASVASTVTYRALPVAPGLIDHPQFIDGGTHLLFLRSVARSWQIRKFDLATGQESKVSELAGQD